MFSVSSISSQRGSSFVCSSTSVIVCTRSSRRNWRGETLTATTHGLNPASCHALFCAHAVCSTQRPIGPIRPVSSAIGMKLDGPITPRPGSCQRISASQPVSSRVCEIEARLIEQLELAAVERAPQVALELEPLLHHAVQLVREELEVVAAVLLRAVHRGVRVLQQRVRVAAVVGVQRHADAAGDLELALRRAPRLRDHFQHPLHRRADGVRLALAVDQQHELVAAEPRDRVVLAHARCGTGPP